MRQMLSNGPPNSINGNFYSKNMGPSISGIPPRHPQLIFSPMSNFSPPPSSLFRSGIMDQSQLNSNSDQPLLFMPTNRCDSRNPLSNQPLSSDANSIELALSSMSNHPFIDSQQNSFFPNSIENSLANNSTPLTMINDTSSSSIMDEPSHMPPLSDEDFLSRIGHHPPNLLQHSNNNLNNCEQNLSPFMNHSSSPFHQNHMKFLPSSGFPADMNGLGDAISASFNNLPSGINDDIITAFSDLSVGPFVLVEWYCNLSGTQTSRQVTFTFYHFIITIDISELIKLYFPSYCQTSVISFQHLRTVFSEAFSCGFENQWQTTYLTRIDER